MPSTGKKKGEAEGEARAVAGTPEAQEVAREGEAAGVEGQMEDHAKAEERRAKAAEKAAGLKSSPRDAEAPPTQKGSGDAKQYSTQRLIDEGPAFLGYPPHVVAGALAGSDKEYLSVDDARAAVESWLGQEVEYVHAEEA